MCFIAYERASIFSILSTFDGVRKIFKLYFIGFDHFNMSVASFSYCFCYFYLLWVFIVSGYCHFKCRIEIYFYKLLCNFTSCERKWILKVVTLVHLVNTRYSLRNGNHGVSQFVYIGILDFLLK